MKKKITTTAFAIMLMVSAFAQDSLTLDINKMRSTGLVSISQNFNFNLNELFDHNTNNWPSSWKTDPYIITLQFANIQSIAYTRVWMETNCYWTIESALTQNDLTSKTGSYKMLVSNGQPGEEKVAQADARFLRMSAYEPVGDDVVHINEWEIKVKANINFVSVEPSMPMLNPGASYTLSANGRDKFNNSYTLSGIQWSSSNTAVATVAPNGVVTGIAPGTANIIATAGSLTGSAQLTVANDFELPLAPTKQVKVALVIENPKIPSRGNKRIHELFGWQEPKALADTLLAAINRNSRGVVNFQFVEVWDSDKLFTKMDTSYIDKEQLDDLLYEPGWATIKSKRESGKLNYDYNGMLSYYDLCNKRNSGQITEVWIYSWPYASFGEAAMAGPNAFNINGPIIYNTACNELLPIMGYNYERGPDAAYESFAHTFEGTMVHVYGRWDYYAAEFNNFEKFVSVDIISAGKSHNGNAHCAPNGDGGYDRSNKKYVVNYSDNWKQYPYLGNKTRSINCDEWGCDGWRYLQWWHSKIPKYAGIGNDGTLNNWWLYRVDYNEALKTSAKYKSAATNPVMTVSKGCGSTGNVSFNWNGSGDNWKIIVSTDGKNFSNPYTKDVSGLSSYTGTTGFTPALTMDPNTTYYWGISDGSTFTVGSTVVTAGTASVPLNYTQNFETTPFPYTNWKIENPDGKVAWQKGDRLNGGGFGKSRGYMYFDNYIQNNYYQKDRVSTASFDFSKSTSIALKFDVAYKRSSKSKTDTLAIYVSTDCGNTFTRVYKKGGSTLSTSSGDKTTGKFSPKSTEWRKETIDLSAYKGQNSVMIMFENISGYGQPIYIDNMEVLSLSSALTAIEETEFKAESINVFPNPSNGLVFIGQNPALNNSTLNIFNSMGQNVFSAPYDNMNEKSVDLGNFGKGIYFMSFEKNGSVITKRVLIQ